MLHDLGLWDELVLAADDVLAWDQDRSQISLIAEPWKARVHLYRGDLGSAERIVGFLDRARAAEDPQIVIPPLTTAAMVELERGIRRPHSTSSASGWRSSASARAPTRSVTPRPPVS